MTERKNTSVRLDDSHVADLASIAKAMRSKLGVEVKPAAVLRAALDKGIAELKAELGIRHRRTKLSDDVSRHRAR